MNNLKGWIHGLGAAFIAAAATSITGTAAAALTTGINPTELKKIGIAAVVSGGISAAAYLRQSPLPALTVTTTQTTSNTLEVKKDN